MPDLRDIVEACAKESPGPWRAEPVDVRSGLCEVVAASGDGVAEALLPADAAFISTFDPVMVGRLLDVVHAARGMVDDGFPHTGAGDEWFDIVSRRLAALDVEEETP